MASGSYTANYTDSDKPNKAGKGSDANEAAGGESVEEKSAREKRHVPGSEWNKSNGGGSGWLGRIIWDALVLLVGVAIGVCAARAYGGYERRGDYQPIDRA